MMNVQNCVLKDGVIKMCKTGQFCFALTSFLSLLTQSFLSLTILIDQMKIIEGVCILTIYYD